MRSLICLFLLPVFFSKSGAATVKDAQAIIQIGTTESCSPIGAWKMYYREQHFSTHSLAPFDKKCATAQQGRFVLKFPANTSFFYVAIESDEGHLSKALRNREFIVEKGD